MNTRHETSRAPDSDTRYIRSLQRHVCVLKLGLALMLVAMALGAWGAFGSSVQNGWLLGVMAPLLVFMSYGYSSTQRLPRNRCGTALFGISAAAAFAAALGAFVHYVM